MLAMRRLIAVTLAAALALQVAPLFAIGHDGTASVSGTARNTAGRPVPNTTVRLRDVTTNRSLGTTASNAAGQFSFGGLEPGSYVVEVVNSTGQIIGTSTIIAVDAGATIAGVIVTVSLATITSAGHGLGTAAIILMAAGGAGVAAIVIVKKVGSPSK
jgi:hypothetical protein